MNLFEKATREAFRFQSSKGQLSVEQLWQLPLQSRDGFDLDSVAKAVNSDVKAQAEESFVTPVKNDDTSRLKLEVVRHIISVKLAERDALQSARVRSEEKQKLMDILARKQTAALEAASEEEILKRLAELG